MWSVVAYLSGVQGGPWLIPGGLCVISFLWLFLEPGIRHDKVVAYCDLQEKVPVVDFVFGFSAVEEGNASAEDVFSDCPFFMLVSAVESGIEIARNNELVVAGDIPDRLVEILKEFNAFIWRSSLLRCVYIDDVERCVAALKFHVYFSSAYLLERFPHFFHFGAVAKTNSDVLLVGIGDFSLAFPVSFYWFRVGIRFM